MLEKVLSYVFRGLATHCADQIALIRTVYPSGEFLLPEPGEEVRLTLAEGRALLRAEGPEEYRSVSDGHVNASKKAFLDGARPFYAIEDRENPKVTNAFDFFMLGRETLSVHLPDVLEARIGEKCMYSSSSGIREYVDIFRSADVPPHGGGGIGLDRVFACYLNLPSVHLASYYPRIPKRLMP